MPLRNYLFPSKIYQNQYFPNEKQSYHIWKSSEDGILLKWSFIQRIIIPSIRKSITSLKSSTTTGLQSFNTINSNKVLKHFQGDFLWLKFNLQGKTTYTATLQLEISLKIERLSKVHITQSNHATQWQLKEYSKQINQKKVHSLKF